ncbi:ATP-binding protein [Spirulina sp. CS-785/01]|uniref:slr1658 superfamily regulator n=1 Tax=Spirulina sp. CS-785/01 TaxID=3021716 RepID=UPI00233091E1|nr:ATP-binding protein [Spirulina sp. CS-785/01]MDB9312375.1 ATP-binding protein [Spirulina sp. CS-785/01]
MMDNLGSWPILSNSIHPPVHGLKKMQQTFGDFIDALPQSPEYLMLGFSPSSIPLQQRWRNNGLSADFLADYFTTFFPIDDENPHSWTQQAEIKSAVSYVANELLENAMKFNDPSYDYPISIALYFSTDQLIFSLTNSVVAEQVETFQRYLQDLIQSDPQEMLLLQLEKNALEETSTSRLGYLTMMNDYGAKLGWKFDTLVDQNAPITTVTTMVQLAL